MTPMFGIDAPSGGFVRNSSATTKEGRMGGRGKLDYGFLRVLAQSVRARASDTLLCMFRGRWPPRFGSAHASEGMTVARVRRSLKSGFKVGR